MLKTYELMTIVKSDLGEEKAKEVSKKIQELIASLEGSVTKTDFWGKRKFAYKVEHTDEGYYDVLNFTLDASKSAELKRKLNLMNEVVRYLVTAATAEKK